MRSIVWSGSRLGGWAVGGCAAAAGGDEGGGAPETVVLIVVVMQVVCACAHILASLALALVHTSVLSAVAAHSRTSLLSQHVDTAYTSRRTHDACLARPPLAWNSDLASVLAPCGARRGQMVGQAAG